ncbi:hypothetical protein D3C81_1628530 [compost metagenome]
MSPFSFGRERHLLDQSRILPVPGLNPFPVRRDNVLGILRSRPFRTNERSFQVDANQLGIRHPSGDILMDFRQHVVDHRFGESHCGSQHRGGTLAAMELSDGIETLLAGFREILQHSAMHMHIDKAGQHVAASRIDGLGFGRVR